ncbi:MAG: hypothetical protein V1726_02830 [Methanobacteriota archaeon]
MKKNHMFFSSLIFMFILVFSGCIHQNESNSFNTYQYNITIWTLYDLYDLGDYEGMILEVNQYLENNEVSEKNFDVLFYRAYGYEHLGEPLMAIRDYEAMLPYIYALDNVAERQYSTVFFSLGLLYANKGNSENALNYYQYGLQLEPQSNFYQIQFGQVYEDLGRNTEALHYYENLSNTLLRTSEEETLVHMRIDRLSGQQTLVDFEPPASYYPFFTIKIIPLNSFDADIILEDLCALIESKYRVACEVISPIQIPEFMIINQSTNQYDAEKIIDYLEETLDTGVRKDSFPVAITSKDMYSGTANFVFSLQDFDADIGVISTYRFDVTLPPISEAELLLERRVGIQCISTVGRLFGSARPTNAVCPLAYPNSIDEFTRKSSKLCPGTQSDVDARIQGWSVKLMSFTQEEKDEMIRVYMKYYFE